MKTIFLTLIIALICVNLFAQAPQSFQYQAVVRDASGTAMVNQSVNFQISILSGSITGIVEYVETHLAYTNNFGIVTLNIGSGNPVTGSFSAISWGTSSHFIKVEADPAGGTSYLDMGTTQLLSVPYSLYSEKAGNIPTYSGGNGVDVTGTTITNTAPDQPVTLTQGGATSITGTYPNFTISSTDNNTTYSAGAGLNLTGTTFSNTAPDQAVSLTQGGATTITGTYPNFTISSTDNNTTYSAGSGLSLAGTTFTNTAPDQAVTMTNGAGITITGTYPSFTVTNSSPNATHTGDVTGSGALTIANNAVTTAKIADGNVTAAKLNSMSATNGQVLKYNGTNWAPSSDLNTGTPGGVNKTVQFNNAGSFGGDTAMIWDNTNKRLGVGLTNPNGRFIIRGSATAPATEPLFEVKNSAGQTVFVVYPDSVHVYVKDGGAKSNKGGFAVSGRNNSKAFTNNFLTVTPDDTRIYTGDSISGFGVENLGAGPSTSYMHLTPKNYFIGHLSGSNITNGVYNSFLGYRSGQSNTTGYSNTFLGYKSGYSNISGSGNIALGPASGYNNISGNYNTFIGDTAGYSNVSGWYNVFVGYMAGQMNLAHNNTFVGTAAGQLNTNGLNNTYFGNSAGFYNANGSDNTMVGITAGSYNDAGNQNTYLGSYAGSGGNGFFAVTGNRNVFIGYKSGNNIISANNNTFVGTNSGYMNNYGGNNVFIGYRAGYAETTSNKLYIANGATIDSTLLYGDFNTKVLYTKAKVSINNTLTPASYLEVTDPTPVNDNPAIIGKHNVSNNWGVGIQAIGGYKAIIAQNSSTTGINWGIESTCNGSGASTNYGIYASASGATTNFAGYFSGNVHVNGTLSKNAGTFRIDHPQDPENKYLVHSFVESPEMKNIYDGTIVLDHNGIAIVQLPGYFETLNYEYRYQLTSIGSYSPVYVQKEIENGQFVIAGGTSGLKVSWQVTGVRKDPYAKANPVIVEEEKIDDDKGYYLNPELYNQPIEKGISFKNIKLRNN